MISAPQAQLPKGRTEIRVPLQPVSVVLICKTQREQSTGMGVQHPSPASALIQLLEPWQVSLPPPPPQLPLLSLPRHHMLWVLWSIRAVRTLGHFISKTSPALHASPPFRKKERGVKFRSREEIGLNSSDNITSLKLGCILRTQLGLHTYSFF